MSVSSSCNVFFIVILVCATQWWWKEYSDYIYLIIYTTALTRTNSIRRFVGFWRRYINITDNSGHSKLKLLYDWRSVSQSVCLGVGHPFGAHDQISLFPFFCRKIALLFFLGRPLWRQDGSVICSAICQWPESRSTHNHTLLSRLRVLGSLSVASYDSQGLRWKYSNPPPHGDFVHRHVFYFKLSPVL
jgi:hypothetical protein